MVTKNSFLRLDEMEPIAQGAIHRALGEYPAPPKEDQRKWTLGKFETDSEGIFEIYIPSDRPLAATVICRAHVDRKTGDVNVEIFLDK